MVDDSVVPKAHSNTQTPKHTHTYICALDIVNHRFPVRQTFAIVWRGVNYVKLANTEC